MKSEQLLVEGEYKVGIFILIGDFFGCSEVGSVFKKSHTQKNKNAALLL